VRIRVGQLATAIVGATTIALGVGVWLAASGGARARTELAVCMAGSKPPAVGTRLERVERAAYVIAARRDPRFAELELPFAADVERQREAWPLRCEGAASRVEQSRWVRMLEPSLRSAAAELEAALQAGYLPRHLDARLLEPVGRDVASSPTDPELEALEPLLGEEELHASRKALSGVVVLWPLRRSAAAPDRVWLEAGATGPCVVEPSGGRPLGAVRCRAAPPEDGESMTALLDGGGGSDPLRCPFVDGAVLMLQERDDEPDGPFELAFEERGTRSTRFRVERGAPASGSGQARWGTPRLSCAPGLARLTWVSSTVANGHDVHELHRARCSRERCDVDVVRVERLETRMTSTTSGGLDPDRASPPELIDLGDRAWLVWQRVRSVAVRAAPFEELATAPTRTLVATYRSQDGLPPFLSAIALGDGPRFVTARDGVALFNLGESVARLQGTQASAAFLLRVDATGAASLLIPDVAP
jgi:hypothetical protein